MEHSKSARIIFRSLCVIEDTSHQQHSSVVDLDAIPARKILANPLPTISKLMDQVQ
jgi:hypothetical protein